eukprot:ANDGO_00208.mRNA.1 hypothetical protein
MKWRASFDQHYGFLYHQAMREFGSKNITSEDDLLFFEGRIDVPCRDLLCFGRVKCSNQWGPLQLTSLMATGLSSKSCNSRVSVMFRPKLYCEIQRFFICAASHSRGMHLAFAQVRGFASLPPHGSSGYAVVDIGKGWHRSNASELVPLHLIGSHVVLQELTRGRSHLVLELSRHPISIEGIGL